MRQQEVWWRNIDHHLAPANWLAKPGHKLWVAQVNRTVHSIPNMPSPSCLKKTTLQHHETWRWPSQSSIYNLQAPAPHLAWFLQWHNHPLCHPDWRWTFSRNLPPSHRPSQDLMYWSVNLLSDVSTKSATTANEMLEASMAGAPGSKQNESCFPPGLAMSSREARICPASIKL